MTLIISTICPDGFVLTSDSRAVDVRTNKILTDNVQKTFHLGNEVYGAFSGQGQPQNFAELIVKAAEENLNFNTTYSMEDVCGFMHELFLIIQHQANPHFRLVCVIAGHDRGPENQKLRARHFTLDSADGYTSDEGEGVLVFGAPVSTKDMDRVQEASEQNVKASNKANKKLIKLISKTNIQVGGEIVSVAVRNVD